MDSEMSADKYTAHQIAAEARRMAGSTWQPIGCERCGGSPSVLLDRDHERLLTCDDCGFIFSIVRCPTCTQRMTFGGDYGAPGVGQAWTCPTGHHWTKLAENLFPAEDGPFELTAEDVR